MTTNVYVQNSENINVCFACDQNYVVPLAVAIASMLKNTKTKKGIDIYILHDYISESKKNKILSLKKLKDKVNIYFIVVDIKLFSFLQKPNLYWNYSVYYRYLVPSILFKVDKAIYLDSDIVVLGDIEELYNINIKGYYLAAIQDFVGHVHIDRLKLKQEDLYCNGGIYCMNLGLIRRDGLEEKFFEISASKEYELLLFDQDVVNIVCNKKIKFIDISWNLQYFNELIQVDYNMESFREAIKNPKIIHFIGKEKPWLPIGKARLYREKYFEYLKYTPWKYYYLLGRDKEIIRKVTIKLLFVIPFIKVVFYKNHKGRIKVFGIPVCSIESKKYK